MGFLVAIYNILVLKIYIIIVNFDFGYILLVILRIIIKEFNLLEILLIIYINLFLFYKCLIKFNIILEKRLIIDISVLR